MKNVEILIIIALAIYSTITATKWKKSKWYTKLFAILAVVLALVIGCNKFKEHKKEALIEKIEASYGDLVDKSDATIPIVAIGTDGKSQFKLGGTGVFNLPSYLPNLFQVYVKENKLYINIVIKDTLGRPIAAIHENTWSIYNNDFEYNDDDNAFELVSKGERYVYFHIELKNGIAYLEGFFYTGSQNQGAYFKSSSGGASITLFGDSLKFDLKYYGIREKQ